MRPPIDAAQSVIPDSVAADRFSIECVEIFSEVMQMLGIAPSVGQIYGLLYSSENPLSFSDIFERLNISKGSVSQGLNLLRSLGAVHTVTPIDGNGRREYFSPEVSLRKLLRGMLNERISPLAGRSTERLGRLRELADQAAGDERKFRLGRTHQLETWRRRLKAAVPVVSALLGPKR